MIFWELSKYVFKIFLAQLEPELEAGLEKTRVFYKKPTQMGFL